MLPKIKHELKLLHACIPTFGASKWLTSVPILPFADKKDICFSQIEGPEKHITKELPQISPLGSIV
jgi:hypothetical protein